MFGSKKSELTRKYCSNWFEAMTFGLSSSRRVAYSQKPTATKSSASTTSTRITACSRRGDQLRSRMTTNSSANGA